MSRTDINELNGSVAPKGGATKLIGSLLAIAAAACLCAASRPMVAFKAPPSDPVAVKVMDTYAKCAVARDRKTAAALVGADYTKPAYGDNMREFTREQRNCVAPGGGIRFNQIVLVGDMAEALLRTDGLSGEALTKRLAALPPAASPSMYRCLLGKDPAGVAALLLTPHASDEESQAIEAMKDALSACAPSERTLVANPVGFRASLALSAYRTLNNIPAPTPREGHGHA